MVNDIFVQQVKQNLPYQPNPSQEELLYRLAGFVLGPETDSLFLLTGYAGTGKTSLIGGVVRTLSSLSFKTVLLAPTGRAAKVFCRLCRTTSVYHTQENIPAKVFFS